MVEKKFRREDTALHDRIDNLSEYVRGVENRVNALGSKDTTLDGVCMALIELAKIDVLLMAADEEDKRSISLMGVKEDTALSPTRHNH